MLFKNTFFTPYISFQSIPVQPTWTSKVKLNIKVDFMACQAVKLDGSVFKAYNKEPNPLRPIGDKVSGANFQQVDQFKMVDKECNNSPGFVK